MYKLLSNYNYLEKENVLVIYEYLIIDVFYIYISNSIIFIFILN